MKKQKMSYCNAIQYDTYLDGLLNNAKTYALTYLDLENIVCGGYILIFRYFSKHRIKEGIDLKIFYGKDK